jgi:photosystem II stability/assembly factor-like uncharacterized protein
MDEQQLFDQFHAALGAEPRPGMRDRMRTALVSSPARPRAGTWFEVALPTTSTRLVAAALAVLLAIAAGGGFVAVYQYAHRSIPARTSFTGSCRQGLDMVTSSTGWNGTGSRTTDGGKTWKQISIPNPPNGSKGPPAQCTFDADHAWIAEPTGSVTEADHVVVFATSNGGDTWQEGAPVAVSPGQDSGLQLAFTDLRHGWLLADAGSRAIFSTSDGGVQWSSIAQTTASGLQRVAAGCGVTGMTFVSADRGWITWDCASQGGAPASPVAAFAAATTDGGRSWSPLGLPFLPTAELWACGANPPVFIGDRGVLPVSCKGSGFWSALYRTADAGDTWNIGRPPAFIDLSQMAMVDGNTAFGFASNAHGNDLYQTTDAGAHWANIQNSLFVGQTVNMFQFTDATTGFAQTSSSGDTPWTTTDGGRTWSQPAGFRTVPGQIACPAPTAPDSSSIPQPVNMFSGNTGWALGALRTTDGGAHWTRAGPPSLPNRASGSAEFYLDGTHAWVAETVGSSSACSDHIVTFVTSDGGRTWMQGNPIPVAVKTPADRIWGLGESAASRTTQPYGEPLLDFVDAESGWLLVISLSAIFDGPIKTGPLYRTTDGGLHWRAVSEQPGVPLNCTAALRGIVFSSATTGWRDGSTCPGEPLSIQVTHDGGATWKLQTIGPSCNCEANLPIFLDANHGFTTFYDDTDSYLLATSDGGVSWTRRRIGTRNFYPMIDFISASEGWVTGGNPDGATFALEHTRDGGKTWAVVNPRLPVGLQGNFAIYFSDSNHGLLWTSQAIFKTTDSGRTWSQIQVTVQ